MLRTTRTELLSPVGVAEEWGMKRNDPDAVTCVAYGYFEQLNTSRTVAIYGDWSVTAWRWTGKLPRDVEPDTSWRLRATVDGREREFLVRNAAHVVVWQLDLQEAA